jgi:hypothetical protein
MQAQLSDQAKQVLARVQDTQGLLDDLRAVMDYQNELTCSHIQEAYLSGPTGAETLSVRTGLLRASANASKSVVSGEKILSGVGSNVVYAAPHEFGVDEMVAVARNFQQRDAMADRFQFGSERVDRFTALRMGILSKRQVSKKVAESGKWEFAKRGAAQKVKGGKVERQAYERHMVLPARGMFQHGIADRLVEYGKAMSGRIVRFWSRFAK